MLNSNQTLSISVVTPSYNQGEFIERTIQSVLSQSFSPMEYLIYDGGSQDSTIAILKKYEAKLQWISQADKGQADAVNQAVQAARGDIIAWINSDDIYYPHALQTVVKFFEEHPDVDVVYGNANHIDTHDQIIDAYYAEAWNAEKLKDVCFICQPATFFRKSIIHKVGLLNDKLNYCMDYEFWLRMSDAGIKIAYLPQLLAGSRLHSNTKTLGSKIKVHCEINAMLKQKYGKVPERWLSNYAYAIADSKVPRSSRWSPLLVALNVLYASLKWNHSLSKKVFSLLPLKKILFHQTITENSSRQQK